MTYTGLLNVKDISSSIVKPKFGIFNPDSSYSKRRINKSGIWGLKDVYEQQKNQSWLFSNQNIRIKNQILSSSPVYNSVSAEKCASNVKLSDDTFCLVYASSNTQINYEIFSIQKGLSLSDGGLISSEELGSITALTESGARVSEISSAFDEVSGRILLFVTYGYGIGGGISGGSQIMTSKSAAKIIIGKYNQLEKSISWSTVNNLYDLLISSTPYNTDPVPTNTSITTPVGTPSNTSISTTYITSLSTFYSTPLLTSYSTVITTFYNTTASTIIGYDQTSTSIQTTINTSITTLYAGARQTSVVTYPPGSRGRLTLGQTPVTVPASTRAPTSTTTSILTNSIAIYGFTPVSVPASTFGFTTYATTGSTPVSTSGATLYLTTITTSLSTQYTTSIVTQAPGDPILADTPPSQIYSVVEVKNIGENKFIVSTHGALRIITLDSDSTYTAGTQLSSSIVPLGGTTELLKTAWDPISNEYLELGWDPINSLSKISRYTISGTTINLEDSTTLTSSRIPNSIGKLINIGERKYIWNDYDKIYQITHNGTSFTISSTPVSLGTIGTGNYNTVLVKDNSIDGFIVGYFSNESTSLYNKIVNYSYQNAVTGGIEFNSFSLFSNQLSNNNPINYVDVISFEDNVFLLIYEHGSVLYANILVLKTY